MGGGKVGAVSDPVGTIYVLHFVKPYRHARHYVGFTEDADAARRVREHVEAKRDGGGASPSGLVRAVVHRGIEVRLVREIEGTRSDERKIKDSKATGRFCPECAPRLREEARLRMRRIRENRRRRAEAMESWTKVRTP